MRYSDVAAQIEERHTTPQDMSEGITRFCIGLTKKVVVANVAGKLVEQYLNAPLQELSVAGAWFGVLLYSIQLYYDFLPIRIWQSGWAGCLDFIITPTSTTRILPNRSPIFGAGGIFHWAASFGTMFTSHWAATAGTSC